jgi:hypothetical protein
VSVPEYDAVIRLSTTLAVPLRATTHIGAGTSPPAGKFIVIEIEFPNSVPEKVPFFTLWQEAHEPSVGFTALSSAVPETEVPVCVSTHFTSSGLNESDPVPLHVPLTLMGAGAEGAVGADGDD